MALIVDKGNKRLASDYTARTASGGLSYVKYKALKLVLPETAHEFDIEAEAPVFISPYVHRRSMCRVCSTPYCPLVYQIGERTTAHHFCEKGGGGIYVRLIEDTSNKWIYTNDLWDCLVAPEGPIRMGDDHGYQFHSVVPIKFIVPVCYSCHKPLRQGHVVAQLDQYTDTPSLVAHGDCCGPVYPPTSTDWNFRYDGTYITFSPAQAPTYQEFMERTVVHAHAQAHHE